MKHDFSGYASKANVLCTDGRKIGSGAFKDKDQKKIPLVWQHRHDGPQNILGHALIEDRPDGVYTYGFFNDTEQGRTAKELVQHGDVEALSIFANQLEHTGNVVVHGNLIEVSLVMAGANPEAWIQNVTLEHADGSSEKSDEAATIWTPPTEAHLLHADGTPIEINDPDAEEQHEGDEEDEETEELTEQTIGEVVENMDEREQAVVHALVHAALSHADGDSTNTEGATMADAGQTVKDVYDAMSPEQKSVVHYFAAAAAGDVPAPAGDTAEHSALSHSQEGTTVNAFDTQLGTSTSTAVRGEKKVLEHGQIAQIMKDGVRFGSLKESVLQHAAEYGINNIDLLFPEAKTVGDMPELVSRQAEWVPKVLDKVKKQPYARIKSVVADITAEEARAKGYIKGKMKKEEVIELLRRSTTPATIYKKQKLDRDDIIDIKDFDVIAWLKWEIRFMLNEELARAILVGDGRSTLNEDKVKDPKGAPSGEGIRSIANDDALYAHPVQLAANIAANNVIKEIVRARTAYRGSGSPTLYTTDAMLTDLLLLEDKVGRRLYETEAALASALRVSEIVAVEVLEETTDIVGIIVNLIDYTVGTDRGGELTFFEDFDIDFNQNKYLLETRLSGALTKPKSALVIRRELGTEATASAPSFDGPTNTITIPTAQGVNYLIDDDVVTGSQVITKDTTVTAEAKDGYYLATNSTRDWTYQYTA